MRDTAAGQLNTPLLVKFLLDLCALLVIQITCAAHLDNQIVAKALVRRDQLAECPGIHNRMIRVPGALHERFSGKEGSRLECDDLP